MPKSPRHPISTPIPELQGIASIVAPAVVSGEAGVEWPERAIRVAEALEHEVMTERGGTLWCRLCSTDCGEDGQGHARSCVLFNEDEPTYTPPVVEEGRREAIERDIRIAIWNAGKWQGKPDEVAQSLIRKAMAEPTMIRALSALSTPVAAQGDEVREALELLRQAMNALGCADKNDPLEPIADNGMTVWDVMRAESNRLWAHYRKLLATLGAPHEG